MWIGKVTMVFQYIFYGKKQAIQHKRSFSSELNGNYTYKQASCLMTATQFTKFNILFKVLTVSGSDCTICVIYFLEKKLHKIITRAWHRYINAPTANVFNTISWRLNSLPSLRQLSQVCLTSTSAWVAFKWPCISLISRQSAVIHHMTGWWIWPWM